MKKILALFIAMLFVGIYSVAQPEINSVNDSPDPVEVPGYNNITADITNASSAYVEIYYPNSTLMGNYSMNLLASSIWFYNHTYAYPDPLGNYSYYVKAYNATGWNTSSSYTFTIQDTTKPSSNVNPISSYWYNSNLSITASATDNYHVSNITLKYRYSIDNTTWGSWSDFSVDDSPPWEWEFNFPSGEGYYRFLTIARDDAGNVEGWPTIYDENAAYDSTPPSSFVNSISFMHNSIPINITANASDNLAGVESVSLWYRYSIDNSTWGAWNNFGSATGVWQWDFDAPNGDGYYEFYTIARDIAGNEEIKTSADENACIDTHPPSTSLVANPSYGNHVSSSSNITLVANDTVSGVNTTYYRIWNGSWHPAPGAGQGEGNNFSIYSATFHLYKEGVNYVEFYSDDVAGNIESIHNETLIVDNTPPAIENVSATPSPQIAGGKVNITCTINDTTAMDGVHVEVEYPDGSSANFTMYHIPCSLYYREETYSIVGTYNFTIYAKDALGNANKTGVYNFVIISGNSPPDVPSTPAGPTSGITGTSYSYQTSTTDPDGDNVFYMFDWGDGSNTTWLGPYSSGAIASASHLWSSAGTYKVRVKAKDIHGAESGWSGNLTVTISSPNMPPITSCSFDPPVPDGKNGWYLCNVNVTLTAVDPEGDAIVYTKYRIDGGAWRTYAGKFEIKDEGIHTIDFYSEDDKGSVEDVKHAEVKIEKSKPYVAIERPVPGYLYLFNRQILPVGNTIIIGRIVVRTLAYDTQSGIENVSFYVDDVLQNIDTAYPYEWLWRGAIGYHYITVEAYNGAGLKEKSPPVLVYIFSI